MWLGASRSAQHDGAAPRAWSLSSHGPAPLRQCNGASCCGRFGEQTDLSASGLEFVIRNYRAVNWGLADAARRLDPRHTLYPQWAKMELRSKKSRRRSLPSASEAGAAQAAVAG